MAVHLLEKLRRTGTPTTGHVGKVGEHRRRHLRPGRAGSATAQPGCRRRRDRRADSTGAARRRQPEHRPPRGTVRRRRRAARSCSSPSTSLRRSSTTRSGKSRATMPVRPARVLATDPLPLILKAQVAPRANCPMRCSASTWWCRWPATHTSGIRPSRSAVEPFSASMIAAWGWNSISTHGRRRVEIMPPAGAEAGTGAGAGRVVTPPVTGARNMSGCGVGVGVGRGGVGRGSGRAGGLKSNADASPPAKA